MPKKWSVGNVGEIPVGQRKIIEIDDKSIGVFNVNGEYVAVLNICPHEFAPVCRGRVSGTTLKSPTHEYRWGREGEILFCPWHGWEFDLLTGDALTDKRKRLKHYPVTVENDTIFVML